MRRIVMFTNTYAPLIGGLERSVANAHEDLNRSGDFCRIVTPRNGHHNPAEPGVLRVPAISGMGRFSLPLPACRRISHWMDGISPQLMHAHQPFLLGGTAMRLAQRRRVPLVFSNHTLYERYAHYLPLDVERATRAFINLTTRYANRCQLVIAPTDSVRRILIDRGVTVPIEIAPSGIDRALYASGCRERARRRLNLAPEDEVVGHLGRLSQEKNLAFLVEAMLRLMTVRPTVKWLLVGDGDRLEWARDRMAHAGLLHRLITPGMLLGSAAADAYATMDLFVFASRTDTQGLVLAEAMSAGVPILALDAPGARDCVSEDVGSCLPGDTNADAFALAAEAMLADKSRLAACAAAARAFSRNYSRERCMKQLSAAYERALAEYAPERAPFQAQCAPVPE